MKIKCLVVDDEPLATALLQRHLAQVDMCEVVGTCTSAAKALEILATRPVDLLFLDIRMPGLSGLELLRALRHPPKTILTTAYREYALDSYELDVVDYLLKPITFDRFFRALTRYFSLLKPVPAAPLPGGRDYLYLKASGKHIRVNLAEVQYVESVKDYVNIHTRTGTLLAKYKIGDLEKELTGNTFLRIHRSYIVNRHHITAFTAQDVEVGATELPIGDSYKSYVLGNLLAF